MITEYQARVLTEAFGFSADEIADLVSATRDRGVDVSTLIRASVMEDLYR